MPHIDNVRRVFKFGYNVDVDAGEDIWDGGSDSADALQGIFHGAPTDGVWKGSTYYPPHMIRSCKIVEPGEKTLD